MKKPRGIAYKTFFFTSGLIILVVIISFSILYFALPRYYFYSKQKSLAANTESLTHGLQGSETQEDCARLISDFGLKNNANIIAFDSEDDIIPGLSSFFLMAAEQSSQNIRVVISETEGEPLTDQAEFHISSEIVTDAEVTDDSFFITYNSTGGASSDEGRTTAFGKLKISTSSQVVSLYADIESAILDKILVTGTLQPIDEAKDVIISLIPYVLVIDILLATAAAYLFSGWMARPILHISQSLARMQVMSPGALSNIRSNDELGQLSENLDALYLKLCANIDKLKLEMEKTNRLEQSKTDFMRAASHELKTPIAALNGILEGMMDNVGVFKNRDKYLKECKTLTERLGGLVGEILQVSRLDNPEQTITIEAFRLEELLEQVLSLYRLHLSEKNLKLALIGFQLELKTDPQLLFTVLSNLISNAAHYTPENGWIRIYCEENTFIIENQCAPISEESLSRLFEPFYTLEYSRDKSKSGTGLGLYIVKRNLETLGIGYRLEKTEEGLRFRMDMPTY